MTKSEFTDEQLIERHRSESGRSEWLNELFGRYQRNVAAWCLRMTHDREQALDLAQEVLMKAYNGLDTFRADSKFSTWLYSITRNHCLNSLSRGAPVLSPVQSELSLREWAKTGDPNRVEARLEAESTFDLVSRSLDETEKRVWVMHFGQGFQLAAITRLLGLDNQSGAKAYVVSARRKLRRAVKRLSARQEARANGV